MDAGRLNKRVTIERVSIGSPPQDEYGAEQTSWATFKEVWAAIEPFQGREFWAQQQVQSEVTIRVRIRYLAGVLPNMRVTYGDRILVIKHIIDPKEAHRELQLLCAEGVQDA